MLSRDVLSCWLYIWIISEIKNPNCKPVPVALQCIMKDHLASRCSGVPGGFRIHQQKVSYGWKVNERNFRKTIYLCMFYGGDTGCDSSSVWEYRRTGGERGKYPKVWRYLYDHEQSLFSADERTDSGKRGSQR